jgi:cell wall-associated NlpC family hydrolase
MTPVSTQSLIAQVRLLVGVPFVHQGRSVHGVDCIGAIALAAINAGLDPEAATGLKDTRDYGRSATPQLLAMVSRSCTRVRQAEPGLLVLFRFPDERDPQHFAILTDRRTVVHADAKQGRVVEHGYRGLWLKWTHSLWRIPGVAYGAP